MIKLLCILLIAIFSSTAFAKPITTDIVVDLDGTLFYTIFDPRQVKDSSQLINYQGVIYRKSNYADEFIQSLLDIPGVRLSFFSGGEADRNKFLLQQIHLKSGGTAFSRAFKILSRNDLTVDLSGPEAEKLPVYIRSKKDLTKISPEVDLAHAVLIDDHPEYILPSQSKNILTVAPAYSYLEDYDQFLIDQKKGLTLPLPTPPSREAWAGELNKLVRARGLLDAAMKASSKHPNAFLDTVHSLQFKPDDTLKDPFAPDQKHFFKEGESILAKIPGSTACPEAFQAIH